MPAGSLFFYQGGKRFLGAPPSLLLLPLSPASAPPPSPPSSSLPVVCYLPLISSLIMLAILCSLASSPKRFWAQR